VTRGSNAVRFGRAAGRTSRSHAMQTAYGHLQVARTLACLVPIVVAGVFTAASRGQEQPAAGGDARPGPAEVARMVLDPTRPVAARESLIREHLDRAPRLVVELRGHGDGRQQQHERLLWIRRVGAAAARQSKPYTICVLLEVSLPRADEALLDWQAVVLGGVVGGMSARGGWPRDQIADVGKAMGTPTAEDHAERLERAVEQAAALAADGQRRIEAACGALRILALDEPERALKRLAPFLREGVSDELQQSAVSALADVQAPETARTLLVAFPHLSTDCRELAIEALLRTPARIDELLSALQQGTIAPEDLDGWHVEALLGHPDEALRQRARKLL
jgi:hypothetical protein